MFLLSYLFFFFFNDTATTEIYTLSLHDALPILDNSSRAISLSLLAIRVGQSNVADGIVQDRKSKRLNSSHSKISYAVFCLKKKKKNKTNKKQKNKKQTKKKKKKKKKTK